MVVSGSLVVPNSSTIKESIRARLDSGIYDLTDPSSSASGFKAHVRNEYALQTKIKSQNSILTGDEIRQLYDDTVGNIPTLNEQWKRNGLSLEERAHKAFEIRHNARLEAREFMIEPFDVTNLQIRDAAKYQNANGPDFNFMLNKYRGPGYNLKGDDVYRAIIDGADKTNVKYNKKFGAVRR